MGRISTLQKSISVKISRAAMWRTRGYFWARATAVIALTCLPVQLSQAAITKVTSSTPLQLMQMEQEYPQEGLLDVGIVPFGVGLEFNSEDETVLPAVRNAEGVYFANQLAKTIEQSGAWGAVRTVANNDVIVDISVSATIAKSDGQTLDLDIEVVDSSGRTWLRKNYSQVVGKYAYDPRLRRNRDPFQNLFNSVSNDLFELRQSLDLLRVRTLTAISNVRFAQRFSPEAFVGYIDKSREGELKLVRLPAEDDSLYIRTQKIRERDYLYIDTMQDYYDHFSQNMHAPYQNWRRASYDVVVKIDRYNSQGNQRIFAGVVAVVAGIYGRYEGANRYTSDFGTATAAAGGYLIKSGLEKKSGKTKFIEDLSEMGSSLEMEIEPQIIKLDDSSVTLSGTVEAQYEQWKVLLEKIYHAERGVVERSDLNRTDSEVNSANPDSEASEKLRDGNP